MLGCIYLHPLAPSHTLNTFRTRAGVRTCEILHIRTFALISKNFFAKKNSGSHFMQIAHILNACGWADVRNFAHPHFRTHFQSNILQKKLQQPHHARCTCFAHVRVWGCAKFRTSQLLHTFSHVQMCEILYICTFEHISRICKQTPATTPVCPLHTFAHPDLGAHAHKCAPPI